MYTGVFCLVVCLHHESSPESHRCVRCLSMLSRHGECSKLQPCTTCCCIYCSTLTWCLCIRSIQDSQQLIRYFPLGYGLDIIIGLLAFFQVFVAHLDTLTRLAWITLTSFMPFQLTINRLRAIHYKYLDPPIALSLSKCVLWTSKQR